MDAKAPNASRYAVVLAQWTTFCDGSACFNLESMYEPIRATVRKRAHSFVRIHGGSVLVEPHAPEHHRALERELRSLDDVAPPCVFVWLGVGYRRMRFTAAAVRHSAVPVWSDAISPTAVARIKQRCKFVYYETEPAPKPNLLSLPFFDAVWSYSTYHAQFAVSCAAPPRRCEYNFKAGASEQTPPWSFLPPLFVAQPFRPSHNNGAPVLLSGTCRAEWEREVAKCGHAPQWRSHGPVLPDALRVLGARNASSPVGLWTSQALGMALENSSIVVNIHKNACAPPHAQPLETVRVSQVLSVGMIIVSQRCTPADEELFAGLVDFVNDNDAMWTTVATYARMPPSERRAIGQLRMQRYRALSERFSLPPLVGIAHSAPFSQNLPRSHC